MSVSRGRKKKGPLTKEQLVFEKRKQAFQVALGKRLRSLREERDLGQEPLAEVAGLHRTHIYMLENAKLDPTISTLLKVADAFNISLVKLLDFDVPQ